MAYFTKIVKGSDAIVRAKLRDINLNENFSLIGMTGCTGHFEKDDGSCLAVSGTVADEDLSEVQFHIEDADSIDLKSGDPLGYEIRVDKGSERTVFLMESSLGIYDTVC